MEEGEDGKRGKEWYRGRCRPRRVEFNLLIDTQLRGAIEFQTGWICSGTNYYRSNELLVNY